MSKAEDFAKRLNGRQYREEITHEEEKEARVNNLLVLFGSSDDILVLRGTILDEVGAYGGTSIKVSKDGMYYLTKNDREREQESYNFLSDRGYKIILPETFDVKIMWSTDVNWLIESNAEKQATFKIFEEDRLFGIGMVIEL